MSIEYIDIFHLYDSPHKHTQVRACVFVCMCVYLYIIKSGLSCSAARLQCGYVVESIVQE